MSASRTPNYSSDSFLITACRNGDRNAQEALFRKHYSAALHLAGCYTRSQQDAEDIASEAFYNVLNIIAQGAGPLEHFRAYLFTAIRNLCAKNSSTSSRVVVVELEAILELENGRSDPWTDDGAAQHVLADEMLRGAFENLPRRWQLALWHVIVLGTPRSDVAEILHISPNAFAALYGRAKRGLREQAAGYHR
ncbi:RNA polymerase sigma factor [Arthrobacter sp. GMC3]|uniref:RNA polymerase sigma factor n=1 Tax=Arthrobacter sp. GMC3 TaxID=2058894 RepID=UPI000CE50DD4|nr:sigma-70 family RNA polymerase sigma factor [Arthrobacter sp. GMC3]